MAPALARRWSIYSCALCACVRVLRVFVEDCPQLDHDVVLDDEDDDVIKL